jgi:hypothetical protein
LFRQNPYREVRRNVTAGFNLVEAFSLQSIAQTGISIRIHCEILPMSDQPTRMQPTSEEKRKSQRLMAALFAAPLVLVGLLVLWLRWIEPTFFPKLYVQQAATERAEQTRQEAARRIRLQAEITSLWQNVKAGLDACDQNLDLVSSANYPDMEKACLAADDGKGDLQPPRSVDDATRTEFNNALKSCRDAYFYGHGELNDQIGVVVNRIYGQDEDNNGYRKNAAANAFLASSNKNLCVDQFAKASSDAGDPFENGRPASVHTPRSATFVRDTGGLWLEVAFGLQACDPGLSGLPPNRLKYPDRKETCREFLSNVERSPVPASGDHATDRAFALALDHCKIAFAAGLLATDRNFAKREPCLPELVPGGCAWCWG